jgi:hypothetical protein
MSDIERGNMDRTDKIVPKGVRVVKIRRKFHANLFASMPLSEEKHQLSGFRQKILCRFLSLVPAIPLSLPSPSFISARNMYNGLRFVRLVLVFRYVPA